jgi:hypothetical protein
MLFVKSNKTQVTLKWHIGEPFPMSPRDVQAIQADCDELGKIVSWV